MSRQWPSRSRRAGRPQDVGVAADQRQPERALTRRRSGLASRRRSRRAPLGWPMPRRRPPPSGLPAIAAMSDTFTAIALKPTASGPASLRPEMAAVHQHVGRDQQVFGGRRGARSAQSSPIPRSAGLPVGIASVRGSTESGRIHGAGMVSEAWVHSWRMPRSRPARNARRACATDRS